MTRRSDEAGGGLRAHLLRELAATGGLLWWFVWQPKAEHWFSQPGMRQRVLEGLWQMVGDGLVLVDMRNDQVAYWRWCLTQRGQQAASGGDRFDPDDIQAYLVRLRRRAGPLDESLEVYLAEALAAYRGRCFLAAAVMAGVAAECAFSLVAEAFRCALAVEERRQLESVLGDPRASYSKGFEEFRRRLEPKKPDPPVDLADGLGLMLNSIAELIRARRNELGHPTGAHFDREDAHALLATLVFYLVKLLAQRDLFARSGHG